MNKRTNRMGRALQRGMVSVIAAFLLIAGVVFILAQSYGILGMRSVDTSQQLDSTAALMLAESGVERSRGILANAATFVTDSVCTGLAGGPHALGRGTFTNGTSVSSPPSCGASGGTQCDSCTVTVTGNVGAASRTIQQTFEIGIANGTAGKGHTVTMVLKNTFDVPAVSLFNLAWKRQEGGGNADANFCANGASDCGLVWNDESSSGAPSGGGMGVTVKIPANTVSKVIVQTLTIGTAYADRDYVEVGGLFPSLTNAYPTVTGSYWDDKNNTRQTTANNNATTGNVITGAAPDVGQVCTPPPPVHPSGGTGSFQADTCTQWCHGGDTMVFGYSGRGTTAADGLSSMSFHTSGSSAQNIPFTLLAHYPNTNGTTPNASGLVHSEVWYAYNAPYTSSNTGAAATSYTSAVSGSVGALMNLSANIGNGDTSVSAASIVTGTGGKICVNDLLVKPGDVTGSTITSVPGGGSCSTAAGTYGIASWTGGNVNKNNTIPQVRSDQFYVTATTGANLSAAAATLRNASTTAVTISSGPSGGAYTLSARQTGGASFLTQGANSTTVRVPGGTALPSVGTRLAIYSLATSGTGTFAIPTTVQSVGTDSFVVSNVPTNGLVGATICGGTCAFFNDPSNTASTNTTQFTIAPSAGTTQWAAGFVCLSGVDPTKILPVTATTTKPTRWQETVQ